MWGHGPLFSHPKNHATALFLLCTGRPKKAGMIWEAASTDLKRRHVMMSRRKNVFRQKEEALLVDSDSLIRCLVERNICKARKKAMRHQIKNIVDGASGARITHVLCLSLPPDEISPGCDEMMMTAGQFARRATSLRFPTGRAAGEGGGGHFKFMRGRRPSPKIAKI